MAESIALEPLRAEVIRLEGGLERVDRLRGDLDLEALIVTRGEEGMSLVQAGAGPVVTNDGPLREALLAANRPVIGLRGRNKLAITQP